MVLLRSPRLRASRRILLVVLLLLLILMFLAVPSVSWADELGDAARQLAQRIVAAVGPRQSVALVVNNSSSLSSADVAAVRHAIEAELLSRGLRIPAAPPYDAEIRVTLSENIQGLLWVAEIRRGESSSVAMVTAQRPAVAAPKRAIEAMTIQKQFLWDQEREILDVWVTAASDPWPRAMILLEPENVAVYRAQGEEWRLEHSIALKRMWNRVRDQRGVILADRDGFQLVLDSDQCELQIRPSPSAKCQQISSGRTPREDELVGVEGKQSPAAHATADLEVNGRRVRVIAGVDDHVRLYEDGAEPVATFFGWGSNLASIKSGCGRGWQLLVAGTGDWTEPDTAQAFEIVSRQAVAVSAAVGFPGPILALSSAQDFRAAVGVVRNLNTGRYEAYVLRISCSQ